MKEEEWVTYLEGQYRETENEIKDIEKLLPLLNKEIQWTEGSDGQSIHKILDGLKHANEIRQDIITLHKKALED